MSLLKRSEWSKTRERELWRRRDGMGREKWLLKFERKRAGRDESGGVDGERTLFDWE